MESASMASMNLIDADHQVGRFCVKPKNVTLIACPWTFDEHVEFRSQQLGLGYVGAYIQKYGHRVIAYIDPMLEEGHMVHQPVWTKLQQTKRFGHPDTWIVDRIPEETDAIGINAPFTDSRIVLYPLIREIKKRFPQVSIIVGGILATTLPRQVLSECPADIVVKGEGEIPFARILNGDSLVDIPGVAFRRDDGTIVEHPERSQQLRHVDDIPPPGYDFRPMNDYVTWSPRGNKADRTLSIISSRGCPFTCEFCSIPEKGQRWRPFTSERVIGEINHAIETWGINHIEFEDDNFTLKEPRALAVLQHLESLRKRGMEMTCSFPNGIMIDKMTRDLAQLLAAAGADIVYLPVESGSTRVLMSMNKPVAEHHLAKTLEVTQWCVEAKLQVSCFFITAYPGGRLSPQHANDRDLRARYGAYLLRHDAYPNDTFMMGEDQEAFDETIAFCKRLRNMGVAGITPLITTPYPGTELYEVCELFNWLAFEDERDILTTISYTSVNPNRVQIDTPWCSQQEAYDRWHEMMRLFPTFHNVRKNTGNRRVLSGKNVSSF